MPSWTEKPHVVPTLNVNLKPCDMPATCAANGGEHVRICKAAPILLPCPLPPSVTFRVVLGGCSFPCTASCQYDLLGKYGVHHRDCPARPISVTCSISGGTWAESEVFAAEANGHAHDSPVLIEACRARWALIKALVLEPEPFCNPWEAAEALVAQRDVVYAALVDMARAEETHVSARRRAYSAIDPSGYLTDSTHAEAAHGQPESVTAFGMYVVRLIELVGVLP